MLKIYLFYRQDKEKSNNNKQEIISNKLVIFVLLSINKEQTK